MKIISSGKTDPGKKRVNNEDAFLTNDEARLYVVADGMGGHEGGEVASRILVETFSLAASRLLSEEPQAASPRLPGGMDPRLVVLRDAVVLSNEKILRAAATNPALSGMGSTVTALHVWQDRAYVAHVGDSRAYLLRSNDLRQLTNDHSLVAEQMRAGRLTPDQARLSPQRHIITRAVGIGEEVLIDQVRLAVRQNDTFFLCTDGLTEHVGDQEIAVILSDPAPDSAARRLIQTANDGGGADNITVVVVKIL